MLKTLKETSLDNLIFENWALKYWNIEMKWNDYWNDFFSLDIHHMHMIFNIFPFFDAFFSIAM